MKHAHVFLFSLLLLGALGTLCAESFRVRSMGTVVLDSQKPATQTIDIGYNDAVGIIFSQNKAFLRAVEIEVKIPQEILRFQNSMAYGVYRNLRPNPSVEVIDYSGTQDAFQPLPSRLSFVLQIPLLENHKLKSSPYATVLERIHNPKDGPIVFRLLPVMKGLPQGIDEMHFYVRIKPLLTDEGGCSVSLNYPDEQEKSVRMMIDEQPAELGKKLYLLSPGDHHIAILSDHYRNEIRTFTVESARITALEISLQNTAPSLFLVAPENTTILVNDKPVENTESPLIIEPGSYTILFKIGDYEVVRHITAVKGKDYTVSMHIDINVSESP